MSLAILVPVLGRPQNVRPLLHTVIATVPHARVLFLSDPDDQTEHAAIRRAKRAFHRLKIDVNSEGGTYAEKVNRGVALTNEPLLFMGADDLRFTEGWFEKAKRHLKDEIGVVGVNDMCNERVMRGEHATHVLFTREYAEKGQLDGECGLLHEGYSHWWCDDELVATAKSRNAFAMALDSVVEHHHPLNAKAPDDETYRKGRQMARHDHRRFIRRSRTWTSR